MVFECCSVWIQSEDKNRIKGLENLTISKNNLFKKHENIYEKKVVKIFADYYFYSAIQKIEDEYTKNKILLIWEILQKSYTFSKVIGYTKIMEDKGLSLI